MQISAQKLMIPLRIPHKQASGEFSVSQSLWVEIQRNGFVGLGEGCPRSYQTGESLTESLAWIQQSSGSWPHWTDIIALKKWVMENETTIDKFPAAWCAVETALLDLMAKESGISVEELLDIPTTKQTFSYSAVVGALSGPVLDHVIGQYQLNQFIDYKVKITGGSEDRHRVKLVYKAIPQARIRLDCNNAFDGDVGRASSHLCKLGKYIWAIEEPFRPRYLGASAALARKLQVPIILDESLSTSEDLQALKQSAGPWIANLKVSRLGGLIRSLKMLGNLDDIPIIVGAQAAETSILTRAGILLARAAGRQLMAQEGAFGQLLLSQDPVFPSLTMGTSGLLDLGQVSLKPQGWGLTLMNAS